MTEYIYLSRTPTPDSLPVEKDVLREVFRRAELLSDPDVRAYLLRLTAEQ